VTAVVQLTPAEREELSLLVAWAMRAALARARVTGLPEEDLESAALSAVESAWRRADTELGKRASHVYRRVQGALLDMGRTLRRRRGREVLLDDLEEAVGPGIEDDDIALPRAAGVDALIVGSPEESLLWRERQSALDREVAKLSAARRRVYVLRHREGLTWPEIQAETGLPERTLQDHDKKIRDHLTAALRAWEA
jgi:RNA polymerase sigma factor (sigma-70 family)